MGSGTTKVMPSSTSNSTVQAKPVIKLIDSNQNSPKQHPNGIYLTDFSEICEITVIIKRKP